jgi:hypothetical protein
MCSACHAQLNLFDQPNDVQRRKKAAAAHKPSTILYFSWLLPLSCVNFLNTTSFLENVCLCYSFTFMFVVTYPSGLQYYVCDWALNKCVLFSRWWLRTANHVIYSLLLIVRVTILKKNKITCGRKDTKYWEYSRKVIPRDREVAMYLQYQ